MANDLEPREWERQDWDAPPAIELPSPLSLLPSLPRPILFALAFAWWIVAILSYRAIGMGAVAAALLTLVSLICCAASVLLYLWTRRCAWRDLEREQFWRLCGWLAIGAIGLSSLPGVLTPLVILLVLACYVVVFFPLHLLR